MEKMETQPEEIIEEQPKVSFLEKLKIHKFKILGGVLGVLVLVGAIFGAYKLGQKQVQPQPSPSPEAVVSPSPDPTADWQTYTNTKYGYSIKYPQGVIARDDKEQNLVIFEFPKEEGWIASLSVWYYSNPENLDPQSFYQKLYDEGKAASEEGFPPPPEPLESKGAKVDNLSGFQVRILAYEAYERITYLGKGDKMVAIRFADENPNDPLQKEHLDIFNLMLSTFRFLEEGEKWQTYTAPKTEFTNSFKLYYPQDWQLETAPVIKLTKSESFFEIRQGAGSVGWCLFEDDKDSPSVPAFATVFSEYKEIIKEKNIIWRLAAVKEPKSWDDTHILCEKKQGDDFFHQETSIGYVPFRVSSEETQMLDEIIEILNKIGILD